MPLKEFLERMNEIIRDGEPDEDDDLTEEEKALYKKIAEKRQAERIRKGFSVRTPKENSDKEK